MFIQQFSRFDIEPAGQDVGLHILAKQRYKLCCATVPYGGISGNHGCEFTQQRVGRFLPKLSFCVIELPCQLLGIPRQMELLIRLISADDFKGGVQVLLKGQMTHRATLGTDPRGNLTRIDNALAQMPQRLEAVKNQLENLYQQQAAAKEEVGKPFPFEDDLRVKSARLVELDTLLNIDGKGHAQPETVVAKSARPSVLDSLKRPVPPRSLEKKPKQYEEVR